MSVIDFSDTIIAKSDQLNASDIAGSITIKITDAKKIQDQDQPVHIFYDGGGNKPWKPCKTMRRVIALVWGSKIDLKGRSITLVCDPKVTWGGSEVGGIRITHMSDINEKKILPVRTSRHKVEKYIVLPLAKATQKVSKESDEIANKVDDELLSEAEEAASMGVETYTSWLAALSEDEKAPIKEHHKRLTQIAKQADQQKKENEDGETPVW